MNQKQALKVLEIVKKTPMDWRVISSYPKSYIKKMVDDIGEAMYVLDKAGKTKQADILASKEYIWLDVLMTKNPRRRRNSGQYAKQIMDLLCSNNKEAIGQAAELILSLYGADFDFKVQELGLPLVAVGVVFEIDKVRGNKCPKADKFVDWLLTYFKNENDLHIHRNDNSRPYVCLIMLNCKRTVPARWKKILQRSKQKLKNPRRRRNSSYGLQLSTMLCNAENEDTVKQVQELVLALYEGEQPDDQYFSWFKGARGTINAQIHYYFDRGRKPAAMDMYQWAAAEFAMASNVLVIFEYLKYIKQYAVTILCTSNAQKDISYYTGKNSNPGVLLSHEGKEYKSRGK